MNTSQRNCSASSFSTADSKLEENLMSEAKQCPNCGHKLDRRTDWMELPAGVKFDPTDQELIEHLEAKVEEGASNSHPLIDEFIQTIEGEDGICYTHPEKLPGVTKDGLSKHFFHRPSRAYTTGTRKRRKIQTECDLQRTSGETRWHKTGKTRAVLVSGRQKGCKKILVLYTNFGKHRKPEKTNWVMHQYHLGELEEERDGELVVSKIFYQTQPRQCSGSWSERRESGSGSCSSSREIVGQREELSCVSGYNALEMQLQMKNNADCVFGYAPLRKSFDEVSIGEASKDEHGSGLILGGHPHQHMSFHIATPANPVAAIVAPSLPAMHSNSMTLDHHGGSFNVSRVLQLQADKFQQQQKLERGSTSGLEELIMSCTSVVKGETSSVPGSQETEWQYSYWCQDNQDHHE